MLVEFILQNAILSGTMVALGGATMYLWLAPLEKHILDPESAVVAMNFQHAQVIDMRERSEYDKGHIPGALHMDAKKVTSKATALAKKKPVILVCARGALAKQETRKLRLDGVNNALVLKGGMTAWIQDGRPTVSK